MPGINGGSHRINEKEMQQHRGQKNRRDREYDNQHRIGGNDPPMAPPGKSAQRQRRQNDENPQRLIKRPVPER